MLPGRHLSHQPLVERVVGFQRRIGRREALADCRRHVGMLEQADGDPDRLSHPAAVFGVRQQPIIQKRLNVRVGRSQRHAPLARRQKDRDGNPNPRRLHAAAAPIYPLGGERLHPHHHVVRALGAGRGVSQPDLQDGRESVEFHAVLHAGVNKNQRMVAEIPAHPRQVAD